MWVPFKILAVHIMENPLAPLCHTRPCEADNNVRKLYITLKSEASEPRIWGWTQMRSTLFPALKSPTSSIQEMNQSLQRYCKAASTASFVHKNNTAKHTHASDSTNLWRRGLNGIEVPRKRQRTHVECPASTSLRDLSVLRADAAHSQTLQRRRQMDQRNTCGHTAIKEFTDYCNAFLLPPNPTPFERARSLHVEYTERQNISRHSWAHAQKSKDPSKCKIYFAGISTSIRQKRTRSRVSAAAKLHDATAIQTGCKALYPGQKIIKKAEIGRNEKKEIKWHIQNLGTRIPKWDLQYEKPKVTRFSVDMSGPEEP